MGLDRKGLPYVVGHLLVPQSHDNLYMPSRPNELVAIFRIDEDSLYWDYTEIMYDSSRVSGICTIVYTNLPYDTLNYEKDIWTE